MFGNLGGQELVLALAIPVLLCRGSRVVDVGGALGRVLHGLRDVAHGSDDQTAGQRADERDHSSAGRLPAGFQPARPSAVDEAACEVVRPLSAHSEHCRHRGPDLPLQAAGDPTLLHLQSKRAGPCVAADPYMRPVHEAPAGSPQMPALSGRESHMLAAGCVPDETQMRFRAVRGVLAAAGRDELLAMSHQSGIREAHAELAEAEDDLEAAWRERDVLLGSIAHELRSPLTVLAGHVARLRRRMPPGGEIADAIEEVSSSTQRLHNTIEGLLALAEVDRAEVVFEPVSVDVAIREAIAEVEEGAERRIEVETNAGLPPAWGSRQWLRQILANLLGNALKYSASESTICVTASCAAGATGGGLVVRVLDRGHGIDPELVERIFEPFVRGPAAAALAPGNGIGLALCKRLVERQGGSIWAAPRPGGGSEFGFSLPAAEPASPLPSPQPVPPQAQDTARRAA